LDYSSLLLLLPSPQIELYDPPPFGAPFFFFLFRISFSLFLFSDSPLPPPPRGHLFFKSGLIGLPIFFPSLFDIQLRGLFLFSCSHFSLRLWRFACPSFFFSFFFFAFRFFFFFPGISFPIQLGLHSFSFFGPVLQSSFSPKRFPLATPAVPRLCFFTGYFVDPFWALTLPNSPPTLPRSLYPPPPLQVQVPGFFASFLACYFPVAPFFASAAPTPDFFSSSLPPDSSL